MCREDNSNAESKRQLDEDVGEPNFKKLRPDSILDDIK